jgi:2-isopropylmalate synthase
MSTNGRHEPTSEREGYEKHDDLVYDWNEVGRRGSIVPDGVTVSFFDETLRDGLQNPSVTDPGIDDKLELLHLMAKLGIDYADIGLPGSSKRAFDDVLRMCREITDHKLPLGVACAGRTVVGDITPMIEISQRAGIPVTVYAFIGSSPIRQLAEEWSVELIAKRSAEAIDVAVKAGLEVCYVTEDTTRSRPEVLATLFKNAIDHGASRLCLCDTVGHSTPDGVKNLIQFTKSVVAGLGAQVGIDWHGHNDRGLGLVNALYAHRARRRPRARHGARHRRARRQRAHGAHLAQPQAARAARAPRPHAPHPYCEVAARGVGWTIPINYPPWAATPSAPPRACTPPPSSRRRPRATRGSPTASTRACPPACSAASKRSASATCRAPRT